MSKLTILFLVLGVVSITHGLTRWTTQTSLRSKQSQRFEQFFETHYDDSTDQYMIDEVFELQKRVMLSGDSYSGWPHAIGGCAGGLILFLISYYFNQKNRRVTGGA